MKRLIVTNFNRNFTGVSATAANVIRQQIGDFDLHLVGAPLPGCPDPITVAQARALSRDPCIWHVRRNPEMRAAIWARDVRRLPIKIVFTSAAQRRHSAYPRWLISRMDAVIATTERAAAFVPNVRAVVPHGVDIATFHPAPNRAEAWAATGHPGARGIATVGRVRPEKGTDHFVTAMCTLLPDMPDTTALVIGRAAREHAGFLQGLKDQAAAAGLADRILFPGEMPAADLPALMRALSLVVQLPRYEGYGMVPLEAMASATPFVGTDAGYYSAFSAGRTAGLLAQPETAAAACKTVLQDHTGFAEQALKIARDQFSARTEADGIAAVYDQLF